MVTAHATQDREAGFTLIDLLFVMAILAVLASLAIPGLMRARGSAQASSALGTMRVVNSAQLSYAITCGFGFYAPDFPTLGLKAPGAGEAFLVPEMTTAATFVRSGYNFSMAGTGTAGAPATCNGLSTGGASSGYAVVADPLDVAPPARYFATNSDGVIYEHSASLASTMPEAGPPTTGSPLK
jgi:prepilin-type N-terminal cleavage/methylation domain-containing protein